MKQDQQILTDLRESKFESVLRAGCANFLLEPSLGVERLDVENKSHEKWLLRIRDRVSIYADPSNEATETQKQQLLLVALAALYAFLQANVTGPPLAWNSAELCFHGIDDGEPTDIRRALIASLSIDGEAAYHLTRYVELFSLAQIVLNHPSVYALEAPFVWARLRVNFVHQQLLNEMSPIIQSLVYQDISFLDSSILSSTSSYDPTVKVLYLLERAAINTFHGLDKKARDDLDQATQMRKFQYILTGHLGKRTKFQQNDISQLVVLAKSEREDELNNSEQEDSAQKVQITQGLAPRSLNLNDDTLLESISFTKNSGAGSRTPAEDIPPTLADLDPSKQPVLDPLDSIILLSVASSITNTSPQHGLTREETLPYATRVLEGGSTNWQVYTQALLVRSRTESYRSRTVERGVLQLQALVDQVIAEVTGSKSVNDTSESSTTFLPRAKESESAPVSERLRYIHQLASPLTWTLEAELASQWVSLGGLRTALEIFERLEMWAEAALCWAATDREDKARKIVRKLLYEKSGEGSLVGNGDDDDDVAEDYNGCEISPFAPDAPRLFCILGDLEKEPKHYERAWEVSHKRYSRAQRSLGKYYLAKRDLPRADDAYSKSLAINPQNGASWFSLGCVRLETMNWKGAVYAFTRSVQIMEDDAEAWSNLAAALLRLPAKEDARANGDDEDLPIQKADPEKQRKEAFAALKRATTIKRDSYRIWQNLLNVAATLSPPPYTDIIFAQQRLIELRSKTEGEGCVDIEVLEGLLAHITSTGSAQANTNTTPNGEPPRKRYGLENMFSDLVQKHIVPLITQSRRLWQLVAKLTIHQNRPSSALEAYEKAWRTALNKPGWDDGSGVAGSSASALEDVSPDDTWKEVADSTIELVDAYESLGEKEITEGLGAGSGELVCKNWRYKAKMAIRSVVGRRTKAGFEDVETLKERMQSLVP
ncbi:MAG: hypothetical protein LQ340_004986 [Diploschistes diacapsis]|nr:MAG: hypothetical protein LQ340_004986 [Diploschistes diacapsis]